MKTGLILFLIFFGVNTVWAGEGFSKECTWIGKWCTSKASDNDLSYTREVSTAEPCKIQPHQSGFRFWSKETLQQKHQAPFSPLITVETRYYQVNCSSKTIETLQAKRKEMLGMETDLVNELHKITYLEPDSNALTECDHIKEEKNKQGYTIWGLVIFIILFLFWLGNRSAKQKRSS